MEHSAGMQGPDVNTSDEMDLTGQLLLAMPGMGDPRFDLSVVFICSHSSEGAMGLIVNKPASDIEFSDLLKQLKIAPLKAMRDVPVHIGGPVEAGRGFVLHSSDYMYAASTMPVGEDYAMTATLDILEDLSRGAGPAKCLLAMGYAGWGPGQLESEIAQNAWLTCPSTSDLIFKYADMDKWQAALKTLGISPLMLSAEGGHA